MQTPKCLVILPLQDISSVNIRRGMDM